MTGFTQLYNITRGQDWEETQSMLIPRRGHHCVSIATKDGEKLMAVGGLRPDNSYVRETELYDPKIKAWQMDERRGLPAMSKK